MEIGAPIDWSVAARTGARIAKEPPQVTALQAATVEADLAVAAHRARELASTITHLPPAPDATTMVIDRPGWLRANIETFSGLITQPDPRKGAGKNRIGRYVHQARARAAGVEIGAVLGWVSARVLGQFDPWADRLVLVAPNVLETEQRLALDPDDFRLWVSIHEETHRLQFAAAPWLRDHLTEVVSGLVADLDVDASVIGQLASSLRRGEAPSVLATVRGTHRSAELFDRATATMSLLEGHADVMMDRVGPGAIPTLRRIRRRFDHKRANPGRDGWLRSLLGLDAKMEQYRAGAEFCRTVIDRIGVPGLNEVWAAPENLPTIDEIADADLWVNRMTSPVQRYGQA